MAETLTDAQIHERIVDALMDQRLAPGTRLREDELGQVFGVSRTRVRQVLIRLAGERVVTLTPNAGARVADPSPEEAHEVFAVRAILEPAIVAAFIDHAGAAERRRLKEAIEAEERAREAGERRRAIRLAGEFHLLLAANAGNATLERMMRELVLRTSLVLMRYGPADHGEAPVRQGWRLACECREHRALLAAITKRDPRAAAAGMADHLARLESQLVFEPAPSPTLAQLLEA